MLIERGARKVVSFDIAPKPKDALTNSKIKYMQGDLTDIEDVRKAFDGCEAVFHIAALVGPFHPKPAYYKVNFEGTQNVLDVCKEMNIKRIVMSSSPSTRFPYPDPTVDNLREDEIAEINGGDGFAPVFLQPYAETKAMGEKLIREACGTKDSDMLTIAVAPHQVYGPRDMLFLHNFLLTAGNGSLRVVGNGQNQVSICHVDNYCHGLILGYEALYEGSPALGKYYVVTDGGSVSFWGILDDAITYMGFNSIFAKMKAPALLVMLISYLVVFFGDIYALLTGTPKHIVNYKLKLNPFNVKMITINRVFNIENAEKDLRYTPVIKFEDGWKQTKEWFKEHWLPDYLESQKPKEEPKEESKEEKSKED
jgi:nucleoside-diphosphate-sugar epimerase